MSPYRSGTWLDGAGALLVAATAGWFFISSRDLGSDPFPAVALLAAAVGCHIAARLSGRLASPAVPAALIVVAAALALVVPGRTAAPLGYANANGNLFVLACTAALFVCCTAVDRRLSLAALVIAVVFGLATLLVGSVAASVLLVAGPVALGAAHFRKSRVAVIVCAAAVLASIAATAVLGATYSGGDSVAGSVLTTQRLILWHDAWEIIDRYPVTGTGFDSFETISPAARSDRDVRWAHNEFLQIGAETGIVGSLLLASLFVWGFARLAVAPASASTAVAAAGLAAVGIHASIDYILHFAVIPVAAAVLVGAALARGDDLGGIQKGYDSRSHLDQGAG